MTTRHTDPDGVVGAHKTETDARQGMTTGHMRWVLRFGVALAIVALAGSWAWFSTHQHVTYGRSGESVNAQTR